MSLLTDRTLILASASPRRLALLRQVGVEPRVVPAQVEELGAAAIMDLTPQELVTINSRLKARAVAELLRQDKARYMRDIYEHLGSSPEESTALPSSGAYRPGCLVVAADTIVARGSVVFGKPADPGEAARMLQALSGKEHRVLSGCCVLDVDSGREAAAAAETKVRFLDLTQEEIEAYVATGEPLDKAGAYGMQEQGALLVQGISGDYSTVVGLSLPLLKLLIGQVEQ